MHNGAGGGFAAGHGLGEGGARVFGGGVSDLGRDDPGVGGLPGYIEVRVNAANGRTYYVNHRTQVTSWTPPPKEDW